MRKSLRELRTEADMTQEEVAVAVGLDRTSYNKIESGERNPSLRIAFKIAKLFDKKVDDIFLPLEVSNRHDEGNNQKAC